MSENYKKEGKYWGLLTSVDLHGCSDAIKDAEAIKTYTSQLCNLIQVKPFGPCTVVHFGEREEIAGYSMTQLIETSLLSGHFVNKDNSAFIDIFSCSEYDPQVVAEFTKKFFNAESIKITTLERK